MKENVSTVDRSHQPLISIVTPFYNTKEYLAECVESVLAQTYDNWEYVLVNNCSTDGSKEIAASYARKDSRIRFVDNEIFLGQVQNYNYALRLISAKSKYCKIVQADDWLFPECLAEMVNVAEAYPSIGIVCSYWLRDKHVFGNGLPYPSTFVSGKDICRRQLLNHPDQHFFGTATALLIRADIVRNLDPFYDENVPYFEDYEIWLRVLRDCDYGFVHKVLTFQRVDEKSISGKVRDYFPNLLAAFICLSKYGKEYLSEDEYATRTQALKGRYFRMLARETICNQYRTDLWRYHRDMLKKFDCDLETGEFAPYFLSELIDALRHPKLVYKALCGFMGKG